MCQVIRPTDLPAFRAVSALRASQRQPRGLVMKMNGMPVQTAHQLSEPAEDLRDVPRQESRRAGRHLVRRLTGPEGPLYHHGTLPDRSCT